jgi:hypothetical protein
MAHTFHKPASGILGNRTKENVLGEECSAYVRENTFKQYFNVKSKAIPLTGRAGL